MLISDAIEELIYLLETHGNLPVYIFSEMDRKGRGIYQNARYTMRHEENIQSDSEYDYEGSPTGEGFVIY